ncbi:response regulator [Niveibacterium umoris]|uniref:Two-component system OmpR family response regulator n=1 Tax=Niveibacterium umoris TaxID=1193620 RepID=A0A840BLU0_9RHOO|nr:response regulator [Niveibacterium umoris]MBB4013603.1 two-component system OmpR family response regulator [Niveibacterium umoris]
METMPHILVVDDDREIRALLAGYLGRNGCRVSLAGEGRQMREVMEASRIDLVVLDLMMPGEDGLSLCRSLRGSGNRTPVIMLTARGEPVDRIVGLEMGADDYLPKPFEPRELLARIRSVLRRAQALPTNLTTPGARCFRFEGWVLAVETRQLTSPDGVLVPLSGAEFRLLNAFLTHPGRVLNRDQLMDLTKGRDADPFDRSIDLQVSRLRTRLGEDARSPRLIKTVRSEGYVFAVPVDSEGD